MTKKARTSLYRGQQSNCDTQEMSAGNVKTCIYVGTLFDLGLSSYSG